MKKRNAYTLIELLATITILGILLGIAIPAVVGYMKRGTREYYKSLENSVLNATRDYLIDYRSLYPREIGNRANISGDELLNNKYITNIDDEDGEKCEANVIVEKTDKDKYEYYVCLKCGDNYSSSEEICNMSDNQNQTKNYVIEVDDFPTEVRQGDELTLPKGRVYQVENGNKTLITDQLDSTPKTIDTTVLGTTNVRWIYRYKSTNPISVRVVDKVSPERPTIKLEYPDGTEYKARNNNGNINVTARGIVLEITSRDYACVLGTTCRSRYPNLDGSGIKEVRYRGETDSTDRIIPTTKTTTRYTENESIWGNVTLKTVDNSNNQSEEISFELYLDNEAPTKTIVTYLGGSNTHSWKNDYLLKLSATDDVEIAYYEIYIDGNYYGTTGSEWTPPNEFSSCKTTFRAVDLAGNKGAFSDSQHIHMDTEAPSIPSVTYNGGSNSCSWKNNYDLTLASTDNIGIDHYELDINGDGISDRTVSSNFIPENAFSSCTVRFRAVDAAGNTSAWTENHHIHMDTEKPSVPTVTYNGGSNSCSWKNNYNLTLSSTDNVSVSYYEIDWNGDNVVDTTTGNNFIPWSGFSSYTTRFRAVDVAGNVSDWTENHHIHMDTENPTHNSWWWGEVTKDVVRLYIQVSDNASGINRVQCPTSTQNGNFTNWYWFNANWDSSANAYRCDITPSTFKHYGQQYQTHLYIYDNADNGGYYSASSVNVPGIEWNYSYNGSDGTNGSSQVWTTPYSGNYQFELWGAQGSGSNGGKGGYTKGTIHLNAGDQLYMFIGGQPQRGAGGYNGGGQPGSRVAAYNTGGGGGATDIRTVNEQSEYAYKRRIMVAGGGGAGGGSTSSSSYGYGGGLTGGNGYYDTSLFCPEESGYQNYANGCFARVAEGGKADAAGSGGKASVNNYNNIWYVSGAGSFYFGGGSNSGSCSGEYCIWSQGGGGGWYGGGAGASTTLVPGGGAGGSSFISGHPGCVAVDGDFLPIGNVSITGLAFTNTAMESGANSGHGKIKVTLISQD